MNRRDREKLRKALVTKRQELTERLERIKANLQGGLAADFAEQAKQLEDRAVVDALGNDARDELQAIATSLRRLETDEFGTCDTCGDEIAYERLRAYPYATRCIRCASSKEQGRA